MTAALANGREPLTALQEGTLKPPPRGLASALIVAMLAVVVSQAYPFFAGSLSTTQSLVAAVIVPLGVFALVPLLALLERRPWREYGLTVRGSGSMAIVYAALFALVFLTLRLEPGFVFGFGHQAAVSPTAFAFFLAYGLATALSQGAIFLGLLFRRLSRRMRLVPAVLVAATFFALDGTDFLGLYRLGLDGVLQQLFVTTLTTFVFGLVLALYFYKSQWSLLGPVTLQAAVVWVLNLLPWVPKFPGWEDAFVALVIAYGILLAAVLVLVQEPRLQAHRYLGRPMGPRRLRFREREANRRAFRDLGLSTVAVAAVVLTVSVALPTVAGTPSTPILAIATGSMVPTFHRGTLVVIEKASPDQIHVGTIIAFHVSCLPAPTVHRVYKILVSGPAPVYLTKGDANNAPDPCDVPYSHVIGRAVVWVPYLGFLILDPLFAAALIVLVVVTAALFREPSRR